jgi:hypothetical protein
MEPMLEDMARSLVESSDYRVTSRLEPQAEYHPPDDNPKLVAAVVDVETTGTNPVCDRVIELGICLFEYHRQNGRILQSPRLLGVVRRSRRFDPTVFVDDMTAGLLELLKRADTAGKTYEFGGPQVHTFKALLELLLTALNRQLVLIPIPFALAEMQAALLEWLPNPPLTRDQVRLLKTDKVVSAAEPTLGDWMCSRGRLRTFLWYSRISIVKPMRTIACDRHGTWENITYAVISLAPSRIGLRIGEYSGE